MAKKAFLVHPTEEQIEYWKTQICLEGKTINDVPDDIRTYIAILLGV